MIFLEQPQLAKGDQIFAVPTLVRKLPEPLKRIIGDLSNEERVLVGLDLRPRSVGHELLYTTADGRCHAKRQENQRGNGICPFG